jgi:hypothetical protein
LRALTGAPLLPLAGLSATSLLASGAQARLLPKSAEFIGMPVPATAAVQAATSVGLQRRYQETGAHPVLPGRSGIDRAAGGR